MFKLGGSAGEGITSGLKPRQGYVTGDQVKKISALAGMEFPQRQMAIKTMYGRPPRTGYNAWDALTEFGLNLASGTPRGNIISTAAHEAKEPFKKFTEGKGEAEMRDYISDVTATDKALDIENTLIKAALTETPGTLKKLPFDRLFDKLLPIYKRSDNPAESEFAEGWAWGMTHIIQNQDVYGNVSVLPLAEKGAGTLESAWVPDANKIRQDQVYFDPIEKNWIVYTYNNEGKITGQETFSGDGNGLAKAQLYLNELEDIQKTEVPEDEKIIEDDYSDLSEVEQDAIDLGIEYELVPPRSAEFTGKNWAGHYKNKNPGAITIQKLEKLVRIEQLKSNPKRKFKRQSRI